jgi:hypothetical protein
VERGLDRFPDTVQVGGEPPDDRAIVRYLRDHVCAAELMATFDQVPAGLQALLVIVRPRELRERLPKAAVIVLEAVIVHAAQQRLAKRRAAETIAVLIDIEDVAARQLVEQPKDPAVIGLSDEQPTELERWLLALEAQALHEPASILAQRREPDQQCVLKCGG